MAERAPWESDEAPARVDLAQLEDKYTLPPRLLSAVRKVESNDNPDAVGPITHTGERAQGAFQFMPATAKQYGIDPLNHDQAADAAGQMYQRLLKKYDGDVDKALAAYNWGEGNVDRKGMDKMPKETRDYISNVKKNMTDASPAAVEHAPWESAPWDTTAPLPKKSPPAKEEKPSVSPLEKALFAVATYPVKLAQQAAGLGEAALHAGSSALAFLPSYAGAAATPPSEFRTAERPALGPSDVQKELLAQATYQPRTEAGKRALKPIEYVGEKYNKYVKENAGELAAQLFGIKPGESIAGDTVLNTAKSAPDFILALMGGAGTPAASAIGSAAREAVRDLTRAEGSTLPAYITGAKAAPQSVSQATRAVAKDAGYQFADEGWDKVRTQLGASKAKVEKQVSEHNETNATSRLAADAGLPDVPLFPAVFEEAKAIPGAVYDATKAAAGPALEATPRFESALRSSIKEMDNKLAYNAQTHEGLKPARDLYSSYLRKIMGKPDKPVMQDVPPIMRTLGDVAVDFPSAPAFKLAGTIERAASDTPFNFGKPPFAQTPVTTPRYATLDTKETFNAIASLREQAKTDFRNGNKDMGNARLGLVNQLENLFEENLAKTGKAGLLDEFHKAREQFAKIYLLEDVVEPGSGMVNLQKLATASTSKRYRGVLTGEFKTAAEFANAFPRMARRGTGEVLSGVGPFDAMFALGSIAAGHPIAAVAKLAPLINMRR